MLQIYETLLEESERNEVILGGCDVDLSYPNWHWRIVRMKGKSAVFGDLRWRCSEGHSGAAMT